eukprot:COSAG01_NODE_1485_length_10131_cov_10.500995_4_plen_201_part_00
MEGGETAHLEGVLRAAALAPDGLSGKIHPTVDIAAHRVVKVQALAVIEEHDHLAAAQERRFADQRPREMACKRVGGELGMVVVGDVLALLVCVGGVHRLQREAVRDGILDARVHIACRRFRITQVDRDRHTRGIQADVRQIRRLWQREFHDHHALVTHTLIARRSHAFAHQCAPVPDARLRCRPCLRRERSRCTARAGPT